MGQIYRHTSPSGKSYIGQTVSTWEIRAGKAPEKTYSTKFSNAIKKHGWENFTHEVLEDEIYDRAELSRRESFWISHFNSVVNGYNSLSGSTGDSYVIDEIHKQLQDLSKEDLERLYVIDGYTSREIGKMFGSHHVAVLSALKTHGISVRSFDSVGKTASEKSEALRSQVVNCSMCPNTFTPSRRGVKTCSKSCRSKLGYENSLKDKGTKTLGHPSLDTKIRADRRAKLSAAMMGNTHGAGKGMGGTVATHNRWHVKREIVSLDCFLCYSDEQAA